MTTNRIIRDMSNAEYHAGPELSNSQLNDLAKSPAHFYALHRAPGRPERKQTPAMMAGTLAHSFILEPASFASRYIVKPDGLDMRTVGGKAWAQEASARGLTVIDAEQMATAEAQRAAVLAVPELAAILEYGAAEWSAYWADTDTGVRCRCRPDWFRKTGPKSVTMLDLKTTGDASPAEFARSIHKYGYHRQAAFYTQGFEAATGWRVEQFVFAAVTNAYPFIAVAYILDDEAAAQGAEEVAELLSLYAQCERDGKWPGFGEGYQLIGLPAWARRSQEIEIAYA